VSEEKPSLHHERLEAKWLAAKAALREAIEDLRRKAESDVGLGREIERVRMANGAQQRARQAWQGSTHYVGRRFGELTVVELSDRRLNGPLWRCQCDCGEVRVVRHYKLSSGEITHCGQCHSPYLNSQKNLTGRRYGMLVVVEKLPLERRQYRLGAWLCRCDCGGTREVRGYRLANAEITNCGCQPGGLLIEMAVGARFGSLTVLERAGNNSREKAIKTRERTLAAGGRPCNLCGAPLRSFNPVCQRCITAAKAKTWRERTEALA
jgi:hypothetical protein